MRQLFLMPKRRAQLSTAHGAGEERSEAYAGIR